MTIAEDIHARLVAAFAPVQLRVVDDSARHAGHAGVREFSKGAGGETHFEVYIVSPLFSGLTRVERQRRVHAELADAFRAGLHALSLKALTPEEASS